MLLEHIDDLLLAEPSLAHSSVSSRRILASKRGHSRGPGHKASRQADFYYFADEDRGSGLGPDERFSMSVVLGEVRGLIALRRSTSSEICRAGRGGG